MRTTPLERLRLDFPIEGPSGQIDEVLVGFDKARIKRVPKLTDDLTLIGALTGLPLELVMELSGHDLERIQCKFEDQIAKAL